MAALCRLSFGAARRTLLYNAARYSSDHPSETNPQKAIDDDHRVSYPAFKDKIFKQKTPEVTDNQKDVGLGYTTGDMRYELLENLIGNQDPFDLSVHKIKYDTRESGNKGMKHDPILVPSVSGERMVGCVCEEDYDEINWLQLNAGEKKKCACNFYFQLVKIEGHSH